MTYNCDKFWRRDYYVSHIWRCTYCPSSKSNKDKNNTLILLFISFIYFFKICTGCVFNQSVVFDYYLRCSGACQRCVTARTHMNTPWQVLGAQKKQWIYVSWCVWAQTSSLSGLCVNTWPWQGCGTLCPGIYVSRGLSHWKLFLEFIMRLQCVYTNEWTGALSASRSTDHGPPRGWSGHWILYCADSLPSLIYFVETL